MVDVVEDDTCKADLVAILAIEVDWMRVFVMLGTLEVMLVICAIVSFLLEVASAVGSIGMANAEMEGGQICRDLAGAMLVVVGEISRPDADLLGPRAPCPSGTSGRAMHPSLL